VGGQGAVWRGLDELTGRPVALKFLGVGLAGSEQGRVQRRAVMREIAALRLLELPGLVRLIDAGDYEDDVVIAMEWIDGRAFPGLDDGASWSDLRRTLLVLLETLQRLHGIGLVHRDLKPSNILIDARGLPVLLDLGIAGGTALRSPGIHAGTPRYQPPEALAGAEVGVATDLFALGVLVFEALARMPLRSRFGGRWTAEYDGARAGAAHGVDLSELSEERLVSCLEGRVPPSVAEVVVSLLAEDPARRPRSAAEVLGALVGSNGDRVGSNGGTEEFVQALLDALPPPLDAPTSSDAAQAPAHSDLAEAPALRARSRDLDRYRKLFVARERILDDRGHAARVLLELAAANAGPLGARVLEADERAIPLELAAWLRAGIGRRVEGGIELRDHDVERLELRRRAVIGERAKWVGQLLAPGAPGPVSGDEVVAPYAADPVAQDLLQDVAERLDRGQLEKVLNEAPVLALVLQGDGTAVDLEALEELLAVWLLAAVATSDRRALEGLLHTIERDDLTSPPSRAVGLVARAAVAALDNALEQAGALLEGVGDAPTFRVGLARQAVALHIGRMRSAPEGRAALARARYWVESTGQTTPWLATWEGWVCYSEGDFGAALEHHLAAAEALQGELRASALLSAAAAAAFVDRYEVKLECVARVQALECVERNAFIQIRAADFEAAARYSLAGRSLAQGTLDEEPEADPDLTELLLAGRAPLLAPQGLLGQAVIHWRRAELDRARELAARACELVLARKDPLRTVLPLAFARYLGVRNAGPSRVDLRQRGVPPSVALQAVALFVSSPGSALSARPGPVSLFFDHAILDAHWMAIRGRDLDLRREVLSLRECARMLHAHGFSTPNAPLP